MSDLTILPINLIVSDPNLRAGRPVIAGTSLRVQDIVIAYTIQGLSLTDLAEQYPSLTPAGIHAALAYYYEHQAEIDADIQTDDAAIQQAKDAEFGQRHKPLLR